MNYGYFGMGSETFHSGNSVCHIFLLKELKYFYFHVNEEPTTGSFSEFLFLKVYQFGICYENDYCGV